MTMTAKRVVELCDLGAALIRQDLALIEAGTIKFQVHGADATEEVAPRIRVVLSYLQKIIDGCGCDCV